MAKCAGDRCTETSKRETASAEAEAEIAVSLLAPEQKTPAGQPAPTPEEKMTALIDLSLARRERDGCASAIPDLRRALAIAHENDSENSIPGRFCRLPAWIFVLEKWE